MDGTIFQTAGLIVLGWFALAIVVGAGTAALFGAARRFECQLPTGRQAIRVLVTVDRQDPQQRRTDAA